MKMYYAHSMALYNTAQERRDVETLETMGFEVVNPNSQIVTEGIEQFKKEYPMANYMNYFDVLMNSCDAIAFRGNPDGKIGAGVWYEIKHMLISNKPVMELPTIMTTRELSVEDTREYLRLVGQR